MTDQACPTCARPVPESRYVCTHCTKTARAHLHSIAAFAGWCDSKRARMGSTWSVGRGSRGTERPVPFDPRVTQVINPIHNDLTTWARIVWDEAPIASDEDLVGIDTSSIAKWLVNHCEWLATTVHGETAFHAWDVAKDKLERLFDRPPDKVYLGRCNASTDFGPCPESLYIEVGDVSAHVACPRCGAATPVDDRRAELAVGVENYLGTARELSRLLKLVLGENASAKTLWAYAKHGLIQQHGVRVEHDTLGRRREVPTYRIGEVREAARTVAQDEDQRKAIRRIMRGEVAA